MTPRLFLKACNEKGDAIMEFIGPEIEENGGNVKKAIESVGDYVSEVVWAEILAEAGLSKPAEEWLFSICKNHIDCLVAQNWFGWCKFEHLLKESVRV